MRRTRWTHHVDRRRAAARPQRADRSSRRAASAREKAWTGWLFTLDQPTYVAVVTDAESEPLRRAFYEAWHTRASDRGPTAGRWDNSAVMENILRLRHEAARLLDFPNYAEYALATRMARSVPRGAAVPARSRAGRAGRRRAAEFAELEAFAGRKLNAWDVGFYAEALQRSRYSRLAGRAAAVLSAAARAGRPVRDGRAAVRRAHPRAQRRARVASRRALLRDRDRGGQAGRQLLSRRLRAPATSAAAPGWTTASAASACPRARPCRSPISCAISCRPSGARPALLTHDDVVTLFHEFGHGLHHLLTRVDYPSLAGINGVAWDAVELPSQFLENYAWHPDVLQRISSHVETGAPLPRGQADATDRHAQLPCRPADDAAARIRAVRLPPACRVPARRRAARIAEILAEVRSEVAVVPVPEWNRFPHSFGHIFAGGYAAGLLQLQMGRGARGRRVRGFRGERRVRSRHGAALSRIDPDARRQPRSARCVRRVPRPRARRARAAQAAWHRVGGEMAA